ncbi:serine protein kinase RIO [Candidatus Micrarchaeota archaeon]|nr:serine protein kinase RIO [Candidatus Micrarchaeota archaeon]
MTKRPLKEDYQLKERFKTESEVFDKRTLLILSKLIKKGMLKTVDYPISTGKEANVFRASRPDGSFVAVKIYKIETGPFFRKEEYLEADPRFTRIKHKNYDIIVTFARKEFKNLEICEKARIHSPKPYYQIGNVLLMEFLGEGELPYPTLNVVGPLHGEADLESLLIDIKKLYKQGLVHADLSEYNVILKSDAPYIIDLGQGVILAHPSSEKFLLRDVTNVLHYFAKFGIKRNLEETMNWIRH